MVRVSPCVFRGASYCEYGLCLGDAALSRTPRMPLEVWLFASAANGEMTEASDIDLALLFGDEREIRPAQAKLARTPRLGPKYARTLLDIAEGDFRTAEFTAQGFTDGRGRNPNRERLSSLSTGNGESDGGYALSP